jgi:Fe2+ transport system protein FeoA
LVQVQKIIVSFYALQLSLNSIYFSDGRTTRPVDQSCRSAGMSDSLTSQQRPVARETSTATRSLPLTQMAPSTVPPPQDASQWTALGVQPCCLSEMEVGCRGCVVHVGGEDPELRRRLLEMGFCNGACVEIVRRAPLGDPIEFRLRGYHLSLRDEQAKHVVILPQG